MTIRRWGRRVRWCIESYPSGLEHFAMADFCWGGTEPCGELSGESSKSLTSKVFRVGRGYQRKSRGHPGVPYVPFYRHLCAMRVEPCMFQVAFCSSRALNVLCYKQLCLRHSNHHAIFRPAISTPDEYRPVLSQSKPARHAQFTCVFYTTNNVLTHLFVNLGS